MHNITRLERQPNSNDSKTRNSHHSVAVLLEFLAVWDLVQEVILQLEVEDVHKWQLEASGQFATRSTFQASILCTKQLILPFEEPGLWKKNASSSYVWWLITAAGQLADCPGEDSLVQSSAPSVNKKMRPSTTSSRVVYLHDNFGISF